MKRMRFAGLFVSLFVLIGACGGAAPVDEIIYVDEPAGLKLLASSDKTQFWPLMRHYQTQQVPTFCAIASSVMVLNVLWMSGKIQPPHTSPLYPCQNFDQDNLFSNEVQKAMWTAASRFTRQTLIGSGTTLEQLRIILDALHVTAEVHYADQFPLAKFREIAATALSSDKKYVIVNYARDKVEQEGNGHMSPLAAYDKATDRFLVLDVSRYKYPATWVTAARLWEAMNTDDTISKKKRGFISVGVAERDKKIEAIRPSNCPPPQKAQFFADR